VINHDILKDQCEIPNVLASCPTGAIRTATIDGKPSVEVIEDQCMYCANCFSVCPAMTLNDAETDGISIWVGGKVSNARSAPKFSKLAVPYVPNNPPRWPEVVDTVKNIVEVYAKNARKYERVGEWIERIGWPKFFDLTGFEFTKYHLDDFTHAGESFARSAHVRHA
jgi:sulfite reductase beta subunit